VCCGCKFIDAQQDMHLLRGSGNSGPAALRGVYRGRLRLLGGQRLVESGSVGLFGPGTTLAVRCYSGSDGIVVAVGATALIGRWLGGRTDAIPKPPVSQHQISALPGRFARSL